ncbi:MAG: hypothetical protein P8Q40_01450 [Candidatus Poseidonia sp.]|uniref:hypothetical protein n=1 Tax=Poseidonia sp. TaxID=2666344 RepID=UPI0030C41037|nr:hypothetical protein [Poseidonia sp.]
MDRYTQKSEVLLRVMEEASTNQNMLKYARWMVILVIITTLSQASTGLSSKYDYNTAASHAWTAQIGLVACIGLVAFVVMSKTDDAKLKGMSFGLLSAWVLQYGLGEMFAKMHWISVIHGVIAMGILLHAMGLLRAIPGNNAEPAV